MTATILDFNSIVLSLIELIKELTSIERDKLKAVTANDMEALNSCIKYEQVQGLKLKGLDKKREQIQASLGYENRTFKEMIPLLAEDQRKESKKLYFTLQQVTDEFNAVNNSVKTALDVNIHSINTSLSKLGLNPDLDHKSAGNNFKNRFA